MSLRQKWLVNTVRIILGLALIFFGLNAFLQFMPAPEVSAAGGAFLGALNSSGYIFPLIGIVFLLSGALFLVNRGRAFASIILIPVSANIVLYHVFLDTANSLFGWVVFILNIYMIYVDFGKCKSLFK